MINRIDTIIKALGRVNSKAPMKDIQLAEKLSMGMEEFASLMDQVCNILPAPVNRAYTQIAENKVKGIQAFTGYVYWPTGVVDKANWEKFTPAKPRKNNDALFANKPAATAAVNIAQPTVQAATERPAIQLSKQDYSDKNMAYRVLKLIETNPGHTDGEIRAALNLEYSINGFLKTYKDHIEFGEYNGKRTYTLTKPVDEFYGTARRGPKPGELHIPVFGEKDRQLKTAALSIEPTDQEVERLATAIEQISKPVAIGEDAEIETGLPFRCAYTNDGCLMFFLEGEVDPIELNPNETMTVIEFISDRIMPISVEIV